MFIMTIKIKVYIKNFLKKHFPNFYEIIYILVFSIILRRKRGISFQGWGLTSSTALPWWDDVKNITSKKFIKSIKLLDEKVISKDFFLAQITNYYENTNFNEVFNHYKNLNYRNYVIHFSSLKAYNNTKSRNIAECGSAEGLSTFFCIQNYISDKNFKAFLYDSWQPIREKELLNEEDSKRQGNYDYLNIGIIKKNLKDYEKNLIFNKGFIPEVLDHKTTQNPEKISWLHIDLNSAFPTSKALEFFYPKVEKNGIILFDDYGHKEYSETRKVIEFFFENKNVEFLNFMTGQAMISKLE